MYAIKQKTIGFTTEIVGSKHVHKEGSFKVSNNSDRQTKSHINQNMGLRQCVAANDQGLVCLLEEDSANFYASNSLLDPSILQSCSDAKQAFKV